MNTEPPTVTFRVDDANPGHTTLSVFVGRTPGARGHAGTLTLRTDELAALLPDPTTMDVLLRIGVGEQLTLRGPIFEPHNSEALKVVSDAWRAHHDFDAEESSP